MKTLQIETGKQQYNLSDKVTVEFSPTDMDFVEKVVSVFQRGMSRQDDIEAEISAADPDSIFEIARRRDKEMRDLVNDLFGVDVCTPLFGSMNTFARDNGFPLWANILTAVLDECFDNLPEESKAARQRIEKYTKKYQKK